MPTYNTNSPSYYWSAFRYIQGYKTFREIDAIAERINGRISATNFGLVRGRSDAADGSASWDLPDPIAAGLVTDDDKREAGILASETLHHVRSSLDHLVYNASWSDQNAPQDKTQFPVIWDESKWSNSRTLEQLGGISRRHADWLKAVQPFSGVNWTGTLQKMSNADKHRVGIEVSPTIVYELDEEYVRADPFNANGMVTKIRTVRCEFLLPTLTPAGNAGKLFDEILVGAGHLINRFLSEAGISPIEIGERGESS